ncbi:MAG: hypothetical protein ACLGSD_03815 [Acidobacteriota bacterium]
MYTNSVYTEIVKNITFSADEDMIEQARAVARSQRRTLNEAFREWLEQYSSTERSAAVLRYDELMKQLAHINSGRRFTRDEMNER